MSPLRGKLGKGLIIAAALLCPLVASPGDGVGNQLPDLFQIPQDAALLVESPDQLIISPKQQQQAAADYLRLHFSPWDGGLILLSKGDLIDKWREIVRQGGFSFNLLPVPEARLQQLFLESNQDSLYSVNTAAITQAAVDLRLLPTSQPLFKKADGAVNSYPFDSLQESRLKLGTPILVSHYSRSGLYAYVIAAEASGWVECQNFALVDRQFARRWKDHEFAVITKYNKVIQGCGGLVVNSQLGCLLPIVAKNSNTVRVLLPARDYQGRAKLYESFAYGHNGGITPFPLHFSQRNCARTIDEIIGYPYGWGGYLGGIDCSAAVRDYFALFGVWLPRNSGEQAVAGERSLRVDGMSVLEKKQIMTSMATPFATIAYLPGHVMLYLGIRHGEPLYFHSVWGIRTSLGDKVHLIGSAVITTGAIGHSLPCRGALLNERISLLVWPVVPRHGTTTCTRTASGPLLLRMSHHS